MNPTASTAIIRSMMSRVVALFSLCLVCLPIAQAQSGETDGPPSAPSAVQQQKNSPPPTPKPATPVPKEARGGVASSPQPPSNPAPVAKAGKESAQEDDAAAIIRQTV